MDATDQVEATVAGLRELADFIEQHPQFESALRDARFLRYVFEEGDFAESVTALGGHRVKEADDVYYGVSRFFGGIELHVYTSREVVCEAKVVGTETVMVPDPDAPKIEVERDVIEWECKPILESVAS